VAAILLALSLLLPIAFRIPLIVVGNLTWLGFVGLVTWQSLRAEPFSSPSEMTIISFVALAVFATILFGVLSLSQSRAQAKTRP
jgi:MFS superfamily sulfate permease-like transporter